MSSDSELVGETGSKKRMDWSCADLRDRVAAFAAKHDARSINIAVWSGADEMLFCIDANGKLLPDSSRTVESTETSCLVKSLTTVACARLFQDRNLSINADAASLIKEFDGREYPALAGVTVEQLLNQTHGLDDTALVTSKPTADGRIDLDKMCKRVADAPRLFEPGTLYSTSDVGHGLIGAVIEAITRERFSVYLSEMLLAPLGMKTPIAAGGEVGLISPTVSYELPVTVLDMTKLMKELSGVGSLGLSNMLAVMTERPAIIQGWPAIRRKSCMGLYEYEGGWYGFMGSTPKKGANLIRFNPNEKRGIAIVSQKGEVNRAIHEIFTDLPGRTPKPPPPALKPDQLKLIDIEPMLGTYRTAVLQAEVSDSAGRLELTVRNLERHGQHLGAPINRKAALAEDEYLYLMPFEPQIFPTAQFLKTRTQSGKREHLWNGRRVWRRVN